MLTREAKQQVDLHLSDYRDELGNDEWIYENVKMTPARRAVRSIERFLTRIKQRVLAEKRPYWQG